MTCHTHECARCGEHYLCSAPLERNYDGWPAVVCVTRMESDPKFQQCEPCNDGHLPCDNCDGERRGTADETGEVLCESCATSRAEAAHERMLEDYYGGSGPVTLDEHYQAAAAQRRELRRHD